ncbi:MAG: ATP-binding cassette domain-containing protein [Oscillospiraceae bacterium]
MTEVDGLCFSYGKHRILNGLSFAAGPGECVVLAGPNGSGKSTALSLLAGVLRPDAGRIRIQGRVGYVPQGTALFEDMSAGENLRFFARLAGCPAPDTLPFGVEKHLDRKVSKMSGGMKKQLSIACALLGDPALLLLDEPCAALDMEYREELIALVRELKARGKTLVYAGHEPMEFASFYDRLLFLGPEPLSFSRAQLSGEPADDLLFCKRFSEIFKSIKK